MMVRCNSVGWLIGRIVIVVVLSLWIVGCGGGGDEGGPPTAPERPERPTEEMDPPSVMDGASNFDGQSVTMSIGGGRTINTANNSYTAALTPVVNEPGYSAREWLVPMNARFNGLVAVTWNVDDPADYLTVGAWAEVSASAFGSPSAPVELGVLFDGPEFRHTAPIPSGAASGTYRGRAVGVYKNVATPGTDHGIFGGEVELDADFQQQTISGCIGCSGTGIGTYPAGLSAASSLARLSSTIIRLEEGSIVSGESSFGGGRVTAESDVDAFSISSASGSWEGVFSNRQNDVNVPRALGGTADGEITWESGETLSFSTSFIGGEQ